MPPMNNQQIHERNEREDRQYLEDARVIEQRTQERFDAATRDLQRMSRIVVESVIEPMRAAALEMGAAVNAWLSSPEGKRFIAAIETANRAAKAHRKASDG